MLKNRGCVRSEVFFSVFDFTRKPVVSTSPPHPSSSDPLRDYQRTCYCGEFQLSREGEQVVALGWVKKVRNHGGRVFADIRDKTGYVQAVFDPTKPGLKPVLSFSQESVVAVKGVLSKRPQGQTSPQTPTGEVEIVASRCQVLSPALTPPFVIDDNKPLSESLNLKYRYLSLRTSRLQARLKLHHEVLQLLRHQLCKEGFTEVTTPSLYKATPEGARDFLVPSRHSPGAFYALPQSPQILKQLLMVGGVDRYFQMARCFRDEDTRSDRQPEFSQLDMEMSFLTQQEIQNLNTRLITALWKTFKNQALQNIPTLSFQEALNTYGTDRPDLRNPLKLKDLTSLGENSGFEVFEKNIHQGGKIKALTLPPAEGGISGSRIKKWTEEVKKRGLKGLIWIKDSADVGLKSSVKKHLSSSQIQRFFSSAGGEKGACVFLLTGRADELSVPAHFLIHTLGKEQNLICQKRDYFVWVKDFPLLEYDSSQGRWQACHHPFTAPHFEDTSLLLEGKITSSLRGQSFDLVCNGYELAGGSMRIHQPKVQQALFKALSLSEKECEEKFGFFVKALQFGTPPHGGIAYGIERLLMLLCGTTDIREVVAFPKTGRGMCLMSQAPSTVSPSQLVDLGIQLVKKQSLK